jgi:hypothetical protein
MPVKFTPATPPTCCRSWAAASSVWRMCSSLSYTTTARILPVARREPIPALKAGQLAGLWDEGLVEVRDTLLEPGGIAFSNQAAMAERRAPSPRS